MLGKNEGFRPGGGSDNKGITPGEALLFGALALTAGCKDKPKPEENFVAERVTVERVSEQAGDWLFSTTEGVKMSLESETAPNYYSWLRGNLRDKGFFSSLPEEDQEAYLNGVITITRKLNPGVSLDNFSSLASSGVDLVIPTEVSITPHPSHIFSHDVGGYGRFQSLAEADGFPVSDPSRQQETYDRALAEGRLLSMGSLFYFLDREGSEDSPPKLASDVVTDLEGFGQDFSRVTAGYLPCITDVMRDPKAQAKRNKLGESTHTTGRSFDVSDGRFKTSRGEIVTWSKFDKRGKAIGPGPLAPTIEKTLRPAIENLAKSHGIFLFRERGHWHAYVPKERKIDLSFLAEVVRNNSEKKETEIGRLDRLRKILKGLWSDNDSEKTEEPVVEVDIAKELNSLTVSNYTEARAARLSEAAAQERLTELTPIIDSVVGEVFPGREIRNAYLTVLTFSSLNRDDLEEYSSLDNQAMLEKTKKWRESPKDTDQKRWRQISQGWIKEKVIDLMRSMSPDQVERVGFLRGTTVHDPDKRPFSDLPGVWRWKRDKKSSKEAQPYVDAILALDLKGMDHSVDMAEWHTKQAEAITALRRHGRELGFRQEALDYLTSEVVLAVIHAEYFSELDGRTFVRLAPILFETYNMPFGPSVNDRQFSLGEVQIILGTFKELLKRYGDELVTAKATDPELKVFLPQPRTKKTGVFKKKQSAPSYDNVDPGEVAQALARDIDSSLFFATLCIADHTRLAFNELFAEGSRFPEIWEDASEEDRILFMASLAPLSINGGVGTGKKVAEALLANSDLKTLRVMAESMPGQTRRETASRGAARGFSTMEYLLDQID